MKYIWITEIFFNVAAAFTGQWNWASWMCIGAAAGALLMLIGGI